MLKFLPTDTGTTREFLLSS